MMIKRHIDHEEVEDEHYEEDAKWDLASLLSRNSIKKLESLPPDREDKALFEEETIKRNVVDETLPSAFKFLFVLFTSSFIFVLLIASALLGWADIEHRSFIERVGFL